MRWWPWALPCVVLLLSSACNSTPSTPTPTPTPSSVTPTLRYSVIAPADPPHLDVQQDVSEVLASMGPGLAYSRLLRLNTGPDVEQPSLALECELCTRWEATDATTYVFYLRTDVRWQNLPPVNGRKLIAGDLVYSYERQRTPGWPNAALLQAVDRLEAPDDTTLLLKLKYADADFLLALADGHSKIVAREAVEVKGDLRSGPVVGSGPWVWTETRTGVGTTLVRNPGYFEAELPRADGITFTVVRDEEAQLAAFATGVADVYRVPPDRWPQLQSVAPQAQSLLSRQGGAGLLLALNAGVPPFDRVEARRAVFQAIDPWSYLDSFWNGQGSVGLGLPVARPDWLLPDSELATYFNHPDRARELLANSAPLPVELTVADFGSQYLRLGERLQNDLRAAGFQTDLVQANPREYASRVWAQRDFQLLLGVLPPASTPNGFLFSLLHSQGRWNISGHADSELDALIEKQSVEMDASARGANVREIERRALDQGYLFSPITEAARWAYWPSRVSELYPNSALSEYFFWARVSAARR
ncbi:MAG: ABC transporter substrate-binding protein [Chloroflexota bacterium]|nr:ABC transporter substrate-binding protein [Chloroflexota bacterium]